MSTIHTYSVPGISCDHCKRAIEGEVTGVADVVSVDVDIDANLEADPRQSGHGAEVG